MKKSIIRVFICILTLSLVLTLITACTEPEEPDAPSTSDAPQSAAPGSESTTTAAAETERTEYDDGLAAADYGKADFRVFIQDRFKQYSMADGIMGDTINDDIYNRNLAVSERFNVNLQWILGKEEEMCRNFKTVMLAGADDYELFMGHHGYTGKVFTGGIFGDWNNTGIDFSMPWFPQYVIDNASINGHMYLIMSDICLSTAARSYCIFYNMGLAEQYNIGDIYSLVENGTWTLDKLTEMSKDIYSDLDGDNKKSADDLYGVRCEGSNSYIAGYIYSLEMDNVVIGNDGVVANNFGSERNLEIIEKLCYLFNDTEGGYMKDAFAVNHPRFVKEQCVFMHGVLEWGDTYYRNDCTFDYGIVPFPKYTESQENYYTLFGGATSIMGLPITVKQEKYDFVRDIVTALSAETWKVALPDYIETTLKGKVAQDQKSIDMIQIVLDGRTFDFAGMYDGYGGYLFKLYTNMQARARLSSFIKSGSKGVNYFFQNVADVFYK